VRNRRANRDHPRARRQSDHPTIENVSGTVREKSRRTIGDFFQKEKAIAARNGLAGVRS
jgi:hypothetical protein